MPCYLHLKAQIWPGSPGSGGAYRGGAGEEVQAQRKANLIKSAETKASVMLSPGMSSQVLAL